jgi:hypothetical protein
VRLAPELLDRRDGGHEVGVQRSFVRLADHPVRPLAQGGLAAEEVARIVQVESSLAQPVRGDLVQPTDGLTLDP